MSAIWMRFRSDLRSRWRSTLAFAVLLGLLGGVVLAAAVGARRTQTAQTRLLQETQALDALVGLVVPPATADDFYRRIAALPQVSEMQRLPGARVFDVDPSGNIDYSVKSLVPMDTVAFRRFGRHKILAGRMPHPDRADEVLVNRPLAQLRDLEVGDILTGFRAFPGFAHPLSLKPSDGVPVTLRVVGIGVAPVEILSDARTPNAAIQTLTPAFYREHVDAVDIAFAGVRLHRGGDDIPDFQDGAERVASVTPGRVPGTPFLFSNAHDGSARARRAITPQATALAFFAILAGLAWALTVGQAFARQISSEGEGNDRLRALGMTQRQLVAVPPLRAAAVGVIAGGTAVVIAMAASPLTPIGTARIAEPNPGFSVNTAWLGAGFAGIVVLMVAVAFLPAWRAAGRSRRGEGVVSPRSDRRSRLGRGRPPWLPITAVLGARVALDPGGGRTATPVRSAVIVTMTTIAAVALSVTFATNLSRLVESPHLYGQDWDTVLDAEVFPIPTTEARDILTSDSAIDSFAAGNIGQVVIGSTTVPALGIDSRPGAPYPTLLDGRKATNPDEIVLGTHALERAGAGVGDSIRVTVGKRTQTMRITGRAVFPKFALGAFQRPELGNGAAVTSSVLAPAGAPDQANIYTFMLVRFRSGVDHASARARLEDAIAPLGPCPLGPCVIADQRPDEVAAYTEIEATPFILTAVLALLALTTLGHTLVTSVRRRTRDFAVLKTVGLSRRQVSAVVAWQATTVAIAAGVVGVLGGLVLGKWAWTEFAQQLGVATDFTVPGVALLVTTPIAVILANLVAAGPGWLAGRVRPATVLRAE